MDIVIYFFILGLAARLLKSDLSLPTSIYDALSIYLLLAIGVKGGVELSKQSLWALTPELLALMAFGFAVPVLLFPLLRAFKLSAVDAAGVGAHFGSVSVVTFAVASNTLAQRSIALESQAPLWLAVMEAPGIIAGVMLAGWALRSANRSANRSDAPVADSQVAWGKLAHDVLCGKSVLLLLGGLIIGSLAGEGGTAPIKLMLTDLFKPALTVFMLELGMVVGARMGDVRRFGWQALVIGLCVPPLLGALGCLLGWGLGLTTGGVAMIGTLAASASYIAAPTALRMAVPQANAALSITVALAIAFPFNIFIGIPLYIALAQRLVA